jgi:hypothetical protein
VPGVFTFSLPAVSEPDCLTSGGLAAPHADLNFSAKVETPAELRTPWGVINLSVRLMAKTLALPAFECLHELFEIVPIAESEFGTHSGLVWKVNRGTRGRAGSVAGSKKPSLITPGRFDWRVRVDGRDYLVSRLIYFMAYEVDPGELTVDHFDRNSLNNNIDNLRVADRLLQVHNRNQQSNNSSGATGVCWHKAARRWQAQLSYGGRRRFLGYFDCLLEAASVYNAKTIEQGFDKLGKPLNDLSALTCNCELHR